MCIHKRLDKALIDGIYIVSGTKEKIFDYVLFRSTTNYISRIYEKTDVKITQKDAELRMIDIMNDVLEQLLKKSYIKKDNDNNITFTSVGDDKVYHEEFMDW